MGDLLSWDRKFIPPHLSHLRALFSSLSLDPREPSKIGFLLGPDSYKLGSNLGIHKEFYEKVFFIFNPLCVTKVKNSFLPWCFGDFPMPNFTMQLMRIIFYFSNIDSLLYTSKNREILSIFKIRVNHLLINS